MKRMLHKFSAIICLLMVVQPSFGQVFKNDAGEKEKHFISEVKQIDEFFERFNNDTSSYIKKVYKLYKTKNNFDRRKLIKSLFNYEGKFWRTGLIDSFLNKALLTKMPNAGDWYGEGWFAEAKCRFQFNASIVDVPVILRIFTDEKKRSRWIITGVRPGIIEQYNESVPIKIRTVKTKFINPANHGTNFIELREAFSDKEHLSDYFDTSFFHRNNTLQFYQALQSNAVKFMFVKDIKYHFLNVSGYVFSVEYFSRESSNSGWLINNLKFATEKDRKNYENQLLGNQ